MNKQEMFNAIVKFAFRQNKGSFSRNHTCAYRGENNTCCFIGALIPDNLYNVFMEEKSVSYMLKVNSEIHKFIVPSDIKHEAERIDFLGDLQQIHDSRSVDEWNYEFKEFASRFGLKYNGKL